MNKEEFEKYVNEVNVDELADIIYKVKNFKGDNNVKD